jgi:P-type Mg2+ transporter
MNGPSFWSLEPQALLQEMQGSADGLTDEEAARRLAANGPNSVRPRRSYGTLYILLNQFKSPITILLIVAALLSFALGHAADAAIILAIILFGSLLGFWQEKGASNAVAELMKLVQIRCSVRRNGKAREIPLEHVVTGDIIELNAGDIVPADALLLESNNLFVDEAAFTGESFPVEKTTGITEASTAVSGRSNAVFMGSHVISGTAIVVAAKTGRDTEFGKISKELGNRNPETDFEKGIRHFGYLLMQITLILVVIIFAVNVLLKKPALDSILFSLALAVGLTPQLLPAIISINLSTGARRMARENVIVKRLSSIENLGSMDILCADKTGTVTEGKVKVRAALDAQGNPSDEVMRLAWLNAGLQKGFSNPIDEAIMQRSGGSLPFTLLDEVPYDFIRKRLTILAGTDKGPLAISKGAFHSMLQVCSQVKCRDAIVPIANLNQELQQRFEILSAEGLRVIAVAYRETAQERFTMDDEKDMVFAGFLTLYDPPKPGIDQTIGELNALGVTLKLITGDNREVARSLAKMIGIEEPRILTGEELRQMNSGALVQRAPLTDIFAEVEPNQKEQIIRALKTAGHVVGFMGDGINDAPALQAADVGISVDTAVDVAKEAADIVLLSQSLDVLGTGIRSGRITFANTMKYIFMATSANFGNMFSMAGISLFLPFLPLLPKQILLTNVMTDIPEMTIAMDKVDEDQIGSPQKWDIGFIKRFMITFGLISSVFDYLTFILLLWVLRGDEKNFQTGWFTESVISASLIVLVVRTRMSFFRSRPSLPLTLATLAIVLLTLLLPFTPLAGLLGFRPLPPAFYGWILLIIVAYIFSAEMAKRWFYRKIKRV